MEAAGEVVLLPDCSLTFMLDYFLEVGPTKSTGMGPVPFGWDDLLAWQLCIGIELPPWQHRLLVHMSREYASFQEKAREEDCPSPWDEEEQTEARRENVFHSLKARMSRLTSRAAKGKIRRRKKGA